MTIALLDVRSTHAACRFGPFELDREGQRLFRDDTRLWLNPQDLSVLLVLTSRPGQTFSKDELTSVGWKGAAVTDSSLVHSIKRLRDLFGDHPDGGPYIETIVGHGYRFAAGVDFIDRLTSAAAVVPNDADALAFDDVDLDTPLTVYDWLAIGRAALESLGRAGIATARDAFAKALLLDRKSITAHVGMATACVLAYESTRASAAPDRGALLLAEYHIREALKLDSSCADAWSLLALVRNARGERPKAIAAARQAVGLEPHVWRHALRLAFVSWGEPRLEAAHRVLAKYPGLALAHWLAASVYIAREAFDAAETHLRLGCDAQDAQNTNSPFAGIGLHLQYGLVLARQGDLDAAEAEWIRELSFESTGHIYASEICGHTWFAKGASCLRRGLLDEAASAFRETLTRIPGHAIAALALKFATNALSPEPFALSGSSDALSGSSMPSALTDRPPFEVSLVQSAALVLPGRHEEAAHVYRSALLLAEPGPAGWQLPVDPLFSVAAQPDVWAAVLTVLRERAA